MARVLRDPRLGSASRDLVMKVTGRVDGRLEAALANARIRQASHAVDVAHRLLKQRVRRLVALLEAEGRE